MIEPAAFHAALERHGLSFFTGVPDSLLKDLCAHIDAHVPASSHVITANEGAAVALAAGHHLATGRIPVVYMQNSGTGNAVNPLLSLADPAVYAIPMLLIIGWRGEPGISDEPQHVTQGRVQESLIRALEIPYAVIDASTPYDDLIADAVHAMERDPRPHALLIRKNTFTSKPENGVGLRDEGLTRADAIEAVLEEMQPDDLLVSTTGMTSREVFAYRERHQMDHGRDFLTVGSMGHASQIALGIALARPDRSIICLDGDGAVLMHMGSLAVVGARQPQNFVHVVIDNEAHDSVGGQPTSARTADLGSVAAACGYPRVEAARTRTEISGAVTAARTGTGPGFVHIKVRSTAHTDAGRPTTSPQDNKAAFMRTIGAIG
jgi:phosphonopyruvate decarboxylase